MQGEFRGDFTRDTYDKSKHFLRVLMQQGRVQLDADWNEQISILLDRLQTLAKDILGFYGGPKDNCGFEFIADPEQINNLTGLNDDEKKELNKRLKAEGYLIGKGNYYVDGILCENEDYISYAKQPDFTPEVGVDTCKAQLNGSMYLAYLDVWERHITYIEDDDDLKASIREVALGRADTATRSKLVWQVKLKEINGNADIETIGQKIKRDRDYFRNFLPQELRPGTGRIKARTRKPINNGAKNPCIIPFESIYRGAENQLYRVEVFTVSNQGNEKDISVVLSRENSSVIFPILAFSKTSSSTITLKLENLVLDNRFSLSEGNWVEIVNDDYILQERPRKLLKVEEIDPIERQVTLRGDTDYRAWEEGKHPFLRRWDSSEINVKLPTMSEEWIALENSIEVQFENGCYQVGDYWLIPVRTTTGDVEWSKKRNGNKLVPEAQLPHGIAHHYAPLAIISSTPEKVRVYDCRRKLRGEENSFNKEDNSTSSKDNNPKTSLPKEFNRVINASWHHEQVFQVSKPEEQGHPESTPQDKIFQVKSQDLMDLFTKLGLVVQFQKKVRVDSLHKSSVFVLAQTVDKDSELAYKLPMKIEPVQVKKTEQKSIRWLRGDEPVNSQFNLITQVEPLKNAGVTEAVRLILPEDWSQKNIFTQTDIQAFTVILRGDWIFNEEVLFNISSDLASDFNKGTVPNSLRQQFQINGISLSENAQLTQEKENPTKWRLTDQNKAYIIRQENNKLTISDGETHALDGNHIWPGVPERPSGNGFEGGDWISVIHIKKP